MREQVESGNTVKLPGNILDQLEADDSNLFCGITFSDIAVAQI